MPDYKGKTIYWCKVNGCLGRSLCGKYSGMCAHVGVGGSESRCHAHGNHKCEHKIKKVG